MKKIYSLIALAITSVSFAQYNGTGTFTKVTSLADLVDGYYAITNENSEVLMMSERNNATATGWYKADTISLTNNNIVDPLAVNVWKIETTEEGKTIYNEVTTKYVGWSSGNSASAEDTAYR